MQSVSKNRMVASRRYLESLQASLVKEGDDRLSRVLADYDTTKFAFQWAVLVIVSILLTVFIRFALQADGWHCLAIGVAATILGVIHHEVMRGLDRYFDRRIYEVVPEDMRWCFRQPS